MKNILLKVTTVFVTIVLFTSCIGNMFNGVSGNKNVVIKDRKINETPQFKPKTDHFGDKLVDNIDFFKLPKNIGKIISGYSNLNKDVNPSTNKDRTRRFLKAIGIAIIISLIIIFLFKVKSPIWMVIWSIVPLGIGLLFANLANSFSHICNFIGVNGFAQFKCEENRKNITQSFEVNFNNVTDFIKIIVINKQNFNYTGTDFSFAWLNGEKLIKEVNGSHDSKEGEPEKTHSEFWLNEIAERYWTIYLLDNMEKELDAKGYLQAKQQLEFQLRCPLFRNIELFSL